MGELTLSMNNAFGRWINVSRMLYNHPKVLARPEMIDHLPKLAIPKEDYITVLWKVAVKRLSGRRVVDEEDRVLVDNIWSFVKTATGLHKQLNEELAGNRKGAPSYSDFEQFMKQHKGA